MSKQELEPGMNLMVAKTHALEDGEMYKLKEACNAFLDSMDEACGSSRGRHTAFMMMVPAEGIKTTMMLTKDAWDGSSHAEKQSTKLRVVDPLTDEGIWVTVDNACNSCCHGAGWRLNAEKK